MIHLHIQRFKFVGYWVAPLQEEEDEEDEKEDEEEEEEDELRRRKRKDKEKGERDEEDEKEEGEEEEEEEEEEEDEDDDDDNEEEEDGQQEDGKHGRNVESTLGDIMHVLSTNFCIFHTFFTLISLKVKSTWKWSTWFSMGTIPIYTICTVLCIYRLE